MLILIKIADIELPLAATTKPELDFEPIIKYDEPSITGRLHKEFVFGDADNDYGNFETVMYKRKFKFSIIGISKDTYDALYLLDGTNTTITFQRDAYTEQFEGNLDFTFFKHDEHLWYDAANVEFTVTRRVPVAPHIMFFGFNTTPPVESNNSLMFFGDEVI